MLSWRLANGLQLECVPVRVHLAGTHTFRVWAEIDSGEGPPVWAEPDLQVTFFAGAVQSPEVTCTVAPLGDTRYRAVGTSARAEVVLEFGLRGEALEVALAVRNPQYPGGAALPLCQVELQIGGLPLGEDGEFLTAHAYGGCTFGYGKLAELPETGLAFTHGCIGLALPLIYLHSPDAGAGLEWEFMLEERPQAGLRPDPNGTTLALSWTPERRLLPQQTHLFPGVMRLTPFTGDPVNRLREWRDHAATGYGLVSPVTPDWARRMNIIEFNMNPTNAQNGFTRLDDLKCRELLLRWKAMGYTAIFAVSHFHVGQHWLSPLNYEPCEVVGGREGERQLLVWAHELGFQIFLWVTTVGIDRDAPEVRQHPDWFTHRPNGGLFYAWDSNPANGYLGYAPDADPLSTGWRQWVHSQVQSIIGRGFDGIYVDGCIPRASNHARWSWPGECRNGVEDQVRGLASFVRGLRPGLITFVEDESLSSQVTAEVTQGRYLAAAPHLPRPYWDPGMGGGPQAHAPEPPVIPPEMAREYLRVRYASLLPGVVSNDMVEGYLGEANRPWAVQSLLAGCVPKTHSEYVHAPGQYLAVPGIPDPPPAEQETAHRLRGHEEFVRLLHLCRDEPLVHDAPLSIDGVLIEGDAAVIGLLRPSPKRCLLALIQFADRPACVRISLAEPKDIPQVRRDAAGRPEACAWRGHEVMHSMVDNAVTDDITFSREAVEISISAYGFRIFELSCLTVNP
ncbi:MAG: alpha-amylase family protein [Armatimonadota bacterium]